ncbi:MAG: phasin family protein [Rudaea sp.]|nr:phasin family protein [Rudaea sp.]
MSKQENASSTVSKGLEVPSSTTKASFDVVTNAYSEWLRNANQMQTEAIRFINERYNKDVKMISRFAECKRPEDFFALQSELLTDLVADYSQESATIFALFSDISQQGLKGIGKTATAAVKS